MDFHNRLFPLVIRMSFKLKVKMRNSQFLRGDTCSIQWESGLEGQHTCKLSNDVILSCQPAQWYVFIWQGNLLNCNYRHKTHFIKHVRNVVVVVEHTHTTTCEDMQEGQFGK